MWILKTWGYEQTANLNLVATLQQRLDNAYVSNVQQAIVKIDDEQYHQPNKHQDTQWQPPCKIHIVHILFVISKYIKGSMQCNDIIQYTQ